jgi:organic hydroperoxide reductase OsmC/OhrA
MLTKTEKHQYFFEAGLTWTGGRKGEVTAAGIPGPITVATPPQFSGGQAGVWSPEHLFLSSLSSCFMTTYLAIAEKSRLAVSAFECRAIGEIHLVEGHLEFTIINLFPKITVTVQDDVALANDVLMKAYKHCIIGNSIKPHLVHHGEVLVNDKVFRPATAAPGRIG